MRGYRFRGVFFPLAAILAQSLLSAGEFSVRTVHIRVLVERQMVFWESYPTDIIRLLRDAFFPFKTRFGIRIRIKDILPWDPDPSSDSILSLLSSLESESKPEGCDIVLGLASPHHRCSGPLGVSCGCLNYALVRYQYSKRDLQNVIQHEICHLFGAVDLPEYGSIMSLKGRGYDFDDFTSKIILLNKNRPFYPASPLFAAEGRDEAISLFTARADLNPEEPALPAMLALLYLEKGDFDSASEQCAKCLALDSESSIAIEIAGHLCLAQGDFDTAISHCRRAQALRPGLSIPHYNLGVALLKKGEIDEAIAEFQTAIQLKPGYLDAYVHMAVAYLRKGQFDPSIETCRQALSLSCDHPEIRRIHALGLILKWEALQSADRAAPGGILEEAISHCQKSILIKPDVPETHNLMGIAYGYAGRRDLAEAEFLAALKLKPDLDMAHLNLALMYYQEKQPEKSAHHLNQILKIDPCSGVGLEMMRVVFEWSNRPATLGTTGVLKNSPLDWFP